MTAESGLGYVAVTTGVGEVGTGTNAGEMTAISDVCEKRTDKSVRIVTVVSDIGDESITTCVNEVGTGQAQLR